ncbi:MAG: serine/threonine-protein kinase, partial [Singulisphaera sp.]
MGVVYLARQSGAEREVALKVINPTPRPSSAFAPSAGRPPAEHDHIVAVYDVGRIDGFLYYTMRYVEGCNLGELLGGQPIDGRRAAAYLEPVARAVQHAHTRHVLHRDLKPRNILVDLDDRPYVADLGLAKLLEDAQDQEMTGTRPGMGTPEYMSPEQAKDASRVGPASDIYSLGAILYAMLTGRPPHQAASPVETLRLVIEVEPVPPRQVNPTIPRDLETICLKCLQKEPAGRYANAKELAEDLLRFLADEPILARSVGNMERLLRWCRRNPALAGLMATAVALLILLTVVAISVAQDREELAVKVVTNSVHSAAKDEA